MCKNYRAIVAQNVPAYGSMEFEAADDFAALLQTIQDCDDEAYDIEWSGAFENRIVELVEVAEDGSEREVATDFLTNDYDREYWDRVQKALSKKPEPTEAERMAKAFQRAEKPVCHHCGCTEITAEAVGAVWSQQAQDWELTDICDKGHYCSLCDGETRIDWQIVI